MSSNITKTVTNLSYRSLGNPIPCDIDIELSDDCHSIELFLEWEAEEGGYDGTNITLPIKDIKTLLASLEK